jgi:hypothetical protein
MVVLIRCHATGAFHRVVESCDSGRTSFSDINTTTAFEDLEVSLPVPRLAGAEASETLNA